MRFVKGCLLNWRWWAALPFVLLFLAVCIPSFLVYVLNDLFDWLYWNVARPFDANLSTIIRPINKWVHPALRKPTNDN